MKDDKTLIVYFSHMGNTEKFANKIHELIGGDIVKLEPVSPYPADYNEVAKVAEKERDDNARPEYRISVNPEEYDNIFVGYPMWYYTLPMIIYKFFDDYDFSGKNIIPFNTHEGSYDGGTYAKIKEFEPNANVLEGLPIRGGDIGVDPDGSTPTDQTETIKNWLNKIGF